MDGLFKVSTKAAIFTRDKQKVLVIRMHEEWYGLPGGHMHQDETPENGMARELHEETGLIDVELEKKDFFVHSNGKIILAYVGILQDASAVASQQDVSEGDPQWVTKDEFSNLNIEAGYRAFVLRNW